MVKLYAHYINPHESHEHADLQHQGKLYGVWDKERPPVSPALYLAVFEDEASALKFIRDASVSQEKSPKPKLMHVGTRRACGLSETGKYWALRLGDWTRVVVNELPKGGGTGSLTFAPVPRKGQPSSYALESCELFWGPVQAWGCKPPRIGKKRLVEAGASEHWVNQKRPRPVSGPLQT